MSASKKPSKGSTTSKYGVILYPLPHFRLDNAAEHYVYEPGLNIRHLSTTERRQLIDAAKSRNCSDWVLKILDPAEVIIYKTIPASDFFKQCVYQEVFRLMVSRFFDSFILAERKDDLVNVRAPVFPSCPFLAAGSPDAIDMTRACPVQSDWKPRDLQEEVLLIERSFEATETLQYLQTHWQKLRRLAELESLDKHFTNDQMWKAFVKQANDHVGDNAIKLAEAYFEEHSDEELPSRELRIGEVRAAKWFFTHLSYLFGVKMHRVEEKYRLERSQSRLRRGFQILVDSIRLEEPNRFVNLVTCLEALVSTGSSELRYQIAARTAWLLYPLPAIVDDCPAKDMQTQHMVNFGLRLYVHGDLSRIYNLRSKVVHGEKFALDTLNKQTDDLFSHVTDVFRRIIGDDEWFDAFMDTNDKKARERLERLILGDPRHT